MLSDISTWILSISGIICVSVIIELIMPDGQMNRYIKGILSFMIILVILTPLPKLINSNINLNEFFNFDESIQVDKDYLYQINLDKLSRLKIEIEEEIQEKGYQNVNIYINADIFEKVMQIKSVNVDLRHLVISQNSEHNDILKIKKDISNVIMDYLNLDEEAILYDG